MYSVKHTSYSGLSGIPEVFEDRERARTECAHRLRRLRKRYPVVTLTPGETWEVREPEGCAMVPDACGVLHLRHITFECAECGGEHETRDEAADCCTPDDYCEEE